MKFHARIQKQLCNASVCTEEKVKQYQSHHMKQTEGMIKISIYPETKIIIVVHTLGPQAGELIAER